MREDLLHFIWKYRKVPLEDLFTSNHESVFIVNVGTHNHLSGPDFFNAQVQIEGQLWAGNVEIHIKSSDWYAHRHEEDVSYNNVILHVVWDDDASVFRKDGSQIPTLQLKNHITEELLTAYQNLFDKKRYTFINCEAAISKVDGFVVQNWLERLYFERLERKSRFVFDLLEKAKNDWEQVLFSLLLKNFGLKINGEAFLSLAYALEFSLVRKVLSNNIQLESIFFGMAHLLDDQTFVDAYYLNLKEEYAFLKRKFDLNDSAVLRPEFFKLRPPNFPTIRLSQLANLYSKNKGLFEQVVNASDLETLYTLFEGSASTYWKNHFTFGKQSKKSSKKITKAFIDLIVINAILPLKFCYAQYMGKDVNDDILQIITQIKSEQNTVIKNFKINGLAATNARDSQAILQLYNEYCTQNKCLQCAIGNRLLSGID